MENQLHRQVAFYLSGNRSGPDLESFPEGTLRPALFARVSDLASLRYDFPLV